MNTPLHVVRKLIAERRYERALALLLQLKKDQNYPTSVVDTNIEWCRHKLKIEASHVRLGTDAKKPSTRTAIFTIAANNYLSYAKVCLNSSGRNNLAADHYLILSDRRSPEDIYKSCEFSILEAEALGISCLPDMLLRYNIMELSTAIKPAAILWLMDAGYEQVVYLDPDIEVYSALNPVFDALEAGASAVFTPHITSPYSDRLRPTDHEILKSGVYNLGFVAFARTGESLRFLRWWNEKLSDKAKSRISENLFTDQRWCDFAPCFIERILILRHSGCNVAYWNLHERRVVHEDPAYLVNNEPLIFVHFSGVVPDRPSVFSKHQTRFIPEKLEPGMQQLFTQYIENLHSYDWSKSSKIPNALTTFSNNRRLPPIFHDFYSQLVPQSTTLSVKNLYAYSVDLANRLAVGCTDSGVRFTELMAYVFFAREDLQRAFDIRTQKGQADYINWFSESAGREHSLPDDMCFPKRTIDELWEPCRFEAAADCQITNLEYVVWLSRSDLRETFDITKVRDAKEFSGWCERELSHVYGIVRPAPNKQSGLRSDSSRSGVNVIGYMRGELGLGEHARATCKALLDADVAVHVVNYSKNLSARQNERVDSAAYSKHPLNINLMHINADQMLFAYGAIGHERFSESYSIGYWAWELENCDPSWEFAAQLVDEIWVPSEFVADAFKKISGKPVITMPECVVLPSYHTGRRERYKIDAKEFIFLCSFDLKSYVHRKNPFAVYAAFQAAFVENERVRLIIKVMNADVAVSAWADFVKMVAEDRRCIIVTDEMSHSEYIGLLAMSDCYVSLHRSEGFGRGPAEAMLLGKPTIATAYSGNMEYSTPESSCLVNYTLVSVEHGQYPYSSRSRWAEADREHAAYLMKRLHSDSVFRASVADAGKKTATKLLSPSVIGARYKRRFREIGLM